MLEPTISYGAIISTAIVVVGFIGTAIWNAVTLGRYLGSIERRLEGLEESEKKMTEVLVDLTKNKVELHLMSKRLDDLQIHGSHKLAEILEAICGQIMSDFKERFEFLQQQIRHQK